MNDEFFLPTYIINLKSRPERLMHIKNEFEGRNEFKINFVEAIEDSVGAAGLWKTVNKIIKLAIENDDDVILICEDDHYFTQDYEKKALFDHIIEANNQQADLLFGGISGGFTCIVPVTKNRLWVDAYWCNQFLIVYKKFFQTILDTEFDRTRKVDNTLSGLTSNKMVVFPFISKQKTFGYSDVTQWNNDYPDWAENRFDIAAEQLQSILEVYSFYHGDLN